MKAFLSMCELWLWSKVNANRGSSPLSPWALPGHRAQWVPPAHEGLAEERSGDSVWTWRGQQPVDREAEAQGEYLVHAPLVLLVLLVPHPAGGHFRKTCWLQQESASSMFTPEDWSQKCLHVAFIHFCTCEIRVLIKPQRESEHKNSLWVNYVFSVKVVCYVDILRAKVLRSLLEITPLAQNANSGFKGFVGCRASRFH